MRPSRLEFLVEELGEPSQLGGFHEDSWTSSSVIDSVNPDTTSHVVTLCNIIVIITKLKFALTKC